MQRRGFSIVVALASLMPFLAWAPPCLAQAITPSARAEQVSADAGLSEVELPTALKQQSQTYRLWPGRAPLADGDSAAETPSLTVYRPSPNWTNGAAVIVVPGGGYNALSGPLEGNPPALWFAARGVTAFVLTYRVGKVGALPAPLIDGARAVRFVRFHAKDFGLDPTRIGIMGFSAGGHLAASVSVNPPQADPRSADPIETISARPNFTVLAYPWLETTKIGADGASPYCVSRTKATGLACDAQAFARYAPIDQLMGSVPPTFIFLTAGDALVPTQGVLQYYLALKERATPVELHVFETGRHGVGLGGSNPSLSQWPGLLQEWLRLHGVLTTPVPGQSFP